MADQVGPEKQSSAEPATAPLATTVPSTTDVATSELPATELPATPSRPPTGATRFARAVDKGPQAKPWRVLSIVLLVLGCVLAPIGVTASWAKNLVVNQDAYLAAVGPLITDPVIVDAAETKLVAAIDDAITNLQIAGKINDELTQLGLPPKLASLATGYLATFRADITDAITNMVDELLTSPKLATIWNNANAAAHTKFVQVMQGQDGQLHTINVDISSAVDSVKQKLQSAGVQWADQIPSVPVVFDISQNADVQMIAGYYDLLNTLGTWLPIVAALLLLLSILIAPSRIGGLSKAAGWLAFSMVVLTVGLVIARQWLISQAPTQPQVTQAFTRQLTVDLQNTIRLIVVLAAVICVVAWMFGRSRSAVGLRSAVRGLSNRVQNSTWNIVVRVVAGLIALTLVLVLVSLDNPGIVLALVLAVVAGLFAIIAFSRPRGATSIGQHAEIVSDDKVVTG